MGGRFFLLGFLFCACIKLSGQIDGVQLMMRLHPVQILSVGKEAEAGGPSEDIADQTNVSVSSTTGFEVSMYRNIKESTLVNVINSNKGAVHKDFAIDYKINKPLKDTYADSSLKSADLVLTLISK